MKILAFTPTFNNRTALFARTLSDMRATAGMWFDWHVYAGAPGEEMRSSLERAVRDKRIQRADMHPHNRGQHYAFAAALDTAREEGYDFLLRLDDDIQSKTKKWLAKMVERLMAIKEAANDNLFRFVAAPYIKGLRNQLQPIGTLEKNGGYSVEIMEILGGACRLHPMDLFRDFHPDLYAPLGRRDPETVAAFLNPEFAPWDDASTRGYFIRFPDIRVIHRTDENEGHDSPLEAHARRMGYAWPYIPPTRSDDRGDQVTQAAGEGS